MSDTITLGDFVTELIYEAGIDGKTGPNARHDTDRIYGVVNRQYKRLRSIVSHNGEDFFRVPGPPTATPGRAAGEDWIELVWPTDATEIVGIDILHQGEWRDLTKGSFAQRRVFPGARAGGVGEWSILGMPQPSTTTVTAGQLVIWPHNLTGNHRIFYLPKWTDITNPLHVLVMFPDWFDWMLTACTMVVVQRDVNKKDTFAIAKERNQIAEARMLQHARRFKRGSVVARRRDGLEL